MTTMNISLPDDMKSFVEAQVTQGSYSTASEYLRDLIRQAQRRQAQLQFEALMLQGIDSGPATPMTPERRAALERRLEEHLQKQGKR